MSIVQAKCENCGASLQVDSDLKAANCPHCGAAYIVQDAINNYNSVTNIEHLHADVVNVMDDSSSNKRLEAADAFYKLGKYENAKEEYKKVIKLTPQDYRGWWGLLSSQTLGFSARVRSKSQFAKLEDYVKSAMTFVPSTKKKELNDQWLSYYDKQNSLNQAEIKEINEKFLQLKEAAVQINKSLELSNEKRQQISDKITDVEKEIKVVQNKKVKYPYLLTAMGTVFALIFAATVAAYRGGEGPHVFITSVSLIAFAGLMALVWKLFKHSKKIKVLNNQKNDLIKESADTVKHDLLMSIRSQGIQKDMLELKEKMKVYS